MKKNLFTYLLCLIAGLSFADEDKLIIIDPKIKTVLDVDYPERFDSLALFFENNSTLLPQKIKIWESQLAYLIALEENKLSRAKILAELGALHQKDNNNDVSKNYFIESLSIFMENENALSAPKTDSIFAHLHMSIANCELNSGQFGTAEERFKIALTHFLNHRDTLSVAVCNYDLGMINSTLDKPNFALDYFEQADSLFGILNSQKGILDARYAICKELMKLSKDKEAIAVFIDLIPSMKEMEHSEMVSASLDYADLLIMSGKYKEAEELLNEQMLDSQKESNWDQLKSLAGKLATLSEKQNQFDKALSFRKIEQVYIDSSYSQNLKNKTDESDLQLFALRQKLEKQNLAQQEMLDSQQQLLADFKRNTFIGFSILSFATIFFFYLIVKNKRKTLAENKIDLQKSKQRLFSSFSNEFTPPVDGIRNLLDGMNVATLPIGVTKVIREAQLTSKRLSKLLNLIINWNKLESKSSSLNNVNGDFAEQVKHSFSNVKSNFTEKDMVWILDVIPERMVCNFDYEKLDILIKTLLENIAEHTPAGGIISLYSRLEENNQIKLVFKDNGKGIPEEKLDQIFKWKYKNNNTDVDIEGYNLAFSMCKDLVNLMGGKMEYIDSSKNGMHFSCLLPFGMIKDQSLFPINNLTAANAQNLPSVLQKSDLELPNILLIVEHTELADHLSNLTSDDFNVSVSNDARVGMDIAFKEIPDLILIKLGEKELGKTRIIQNLKNNMLTEHITIISLDANVKAEINGFDELIEIPKEKTGLFISKLKTILENQIKELLSPLDLREEQFSRFKIQLKHAIEENYQDSSLTTDTLASNMKISKGQLHKKTKAIFNSTPSSILTEFRLQKAKQMVDSQSYIIEEVVNSCGFKSEKLFNKLYDAKFKN